MFLLGSSLAALVSPGLFLVGAAAMSAPILIHLLARRRFKRIRWAAIEFVLSADRENRRRIRMEDWILLALRCAAILAIALVVSRPFLTPASGSARWGSLGRTERIFVLDDSFSMAYESDGRSSFARAKEAIHVLVASVRAQFPDDSVTLVRATMPRQPVEAGVYLDDEQTQVLLDRLEALAPAHRTTVPTDVVKALVEMLERDSELLNVAVYFLSDFQRFGWREATEKRPAGDMSGKVFDPLLAWAGDRRTLHVTLINTGDKQAENIALTALSELAKQGKYPESKLPTAIKKLNIDPKKPNPWSV